MKYEKKWIFVWLTKNIKKVKIEYVFQQLPKTVNSGTDLMIKLRETGWKYSKYRVHER